MTDLYLGLAIMTFLMGVMFALAMVGTRRAPMWVVDALAGLTVIGIAVYARFIWDESFVARLLPFSNLIIVGNWIPLAAGLLSGFVWRRIGDVPAKFLGLGSQEFSSTPRKILAASVLCLVGFVFMAWPLMGTTPDCGVDWQGNICLQTTSATCSAAAGATLLQSYGVYASEQEMAELSLTTGRGTNWKGLYRGLTLKGKEAGRKVEVLEWSVDELSDHLGEPLILQCELLLNEQASDIRYDMEGWVRGQAHSVVLLDTYDTGSQKLFVIADPSLQDQVIEGWTREDLETLWHGQILRLVPDKHHPTNAND